MGENFLFLVSTVPTSSQPLALNPRATLAFPRYRDGNDSSEVAYKGRKGRRRKRGKDISGFMVAYLPSIMPAAEDGNRRGVNWYGQGENTLSPIVTSFSVLLSLPQEEKTRWVRC